MLYFIVPIINTTLNYKERALGERPNANKSIIKNGIFSTQAFLGKTLPLYLLDIQIIKPYENNDFKNEAPF